MLARSPSLKMDVLGWRRYLKQVQILQVLHRLLPTNDFNDAYRLMLREGEGAIQVRTGGP